MSEQDFQGAVALHREMLELIEVEQLAPHMGDYYEVAARLHAAARDIKAAKKYARLALDEFRAGGTGEIKEDLERFVKYA